MNPLPRSDDCRTLANVRLECGSGPVDLDVDRGRIAAIRPTADPTGGWGGRLAFPGFADTHLHLDKAHLLDRTPPGSGLAEAVAHVRAAKQGFTVDDVCRRAAQVLDRAVVHGTTLMRTFVEVDPAAGLRSWEALDSLRRAYADKLDLRLSAFAQDGTTQSPGTLALLARALESGADEVGGCPYTDPDPGRHIDAILGLADRYGVRADFHVDLDLDPSWDHLHLILDAVERHRLQGRVSIGHATKLAVLPDARRDDLVRRSADLGVGLVVLPATDLFLVGAVAPAPAATAVATNNVCNPFTPFGDADLLRMANLYATVSRLSDDDGTATVWGMVTTGAASLLGETRTLAVGAAATLVVLDAPDPVTALRELRQPLAGWKDGRPTFTWATPTITGRPGSPRPDR